jgi:hypothetical protein
MAIIGCRAIGKAEIKRGKRKMDKMKELYAKVAEDSILQAQFAEIMKDAAEAGEVTKEKLTAFAKEAGYDVSLEEAQEYFKPLVLTGQNEAALSDAELDMVAGGKSLEGKRNVADSILTFGIGCMIYSIVFAVEHSKGMRAATCDDLYQ